MPEFETMAVKTENGLKKAKNLILIKHLFEMTAGFSYDIASPQILKCQKETKGKCSTREVMRYLAKEPLLFEPGDRWEYSLCHDVLAALIEVISGMKFYDYVKQYIFDILGMNDSTFMLPDSEIDTVSPQYVFEDGKLSCVGNHIRFYKVGNEYASGGAGCVSTVDDYIKFAEGLRTNVLLKPETVEIMQTINPDVPEMFSKEEFDANETTDIDGMTGGHGGGDLRLVSDFIDHIITGKSSIACTEVSISAIGHKIVFAAERSRKTGEIVKI